MIHADFETRSTIDLIKRGAYVYAAHPSTDINCLGWAIGDGEVGLWLPGQPFPEELLERIEAGDMIAAWNAQFERLIWNNVLADYGVPQLPIKRFYCIAALSRARGFPGKLEKAARFAGLAYQKDMDGHYLMLKLCKPRRIEEDGTIVWWDYPEDYQRLGEYCKQDVIVERAMFNSFIPFTEQELADFHLSEEINDRGVCVDIALANAAVISVTKEKITATDELIALTDGEVTTHNQVERILDWVEKEWKRLPDLNKSTVLDAMQEDDIPPHVYDVLEIRIENARAAVSKFAAMIDRSQDGIVRGLYMFRGAGQTGRYTSTGLQIQNLVRDSAVHAIPVLKKHGIAGLRMLGDPVPLLSQMVRPSFIASPGNMFLIGDYSQIEARITAWLAGEEKLLSLFREGKDPYCAFGTIAYKRPITKADELERFVSKGCVLGLGFGGAEGALARTLKSQGNVVLPVNELTGFVYTYRGEYKKIVQFWYKLRDAILNAMYSRGTLVEIGPVSYMFNDGHLWCRLPSGRLICYPYARIVTDDYGDSVEYRRGNRSPKSGVMEWPVVNLWYGMATENLAQAIAFDFLMGAMRRMRERFPTRLHIHDELVSEAAFEEAKELLPVFLDIMMEGEEWAEGFPLKAEGKVSQRYVK